MTAPTSVWERMSHLQLGKVAEDLVRIELIKLGLDVFSPAVDERGIDHAIRIGDGLFLEVQVKSCRNWNYVFVHKSKFSIRSNLLLALVLFQDPELTEVFLIPSGRWLTCDSLFKSRDYEGKKSFPEWGLDLRPSKRDLLEPFRLNRELWNAVLRESNNSVLQTSSGFLTRVAGISH
jgi:hypothetical protein